MADSTENASAWKAYPVTERADMLLDFADISPGKMEKRRRKRDRKICDKCRKTQENSVRKIEKTGRVPEGTRKNPGKQKTPLRKARYNRLRDGVKSSLFAF